MVRLTTSIAFAAAFAAATVAAAPVKDAKLEAEKAQYQKKISAINTVENLRGDRMRIGAKKRLDNKKSDYQKKIDEINKKEGITVTKPGQKTPTTPTKSKKKHAKLEAEKAKLQKNINAIKTVEDLRGDRMSVGGKKKLDGKIAKMQQQVDAINTVEGLSPREPAPTKSKKKHARLEAEKAKLQKNINAIKTVEDLRGDRMSVGGKKKLDGKIAKMQQQVDAINTVEGLSPREPAPTKSKKKHARLEAEKAKLQKNINAIKTVEGLRGDRMSIGGKKKLDGKMAKMQQQVDAINTVEGLSPREPEPIAPVVAKKPVPFVKPAQNKQQKPKKKFAKLEAEKAKLQKNVDAINTVEGLRGDRMTIGARKKLDGKKAFYQKEIDAINTVETLDRRDFEEDMEERDFEDMEFEERGFEDYELELLD